MKKILSVFLFLFLILALGKLVSSAAPVTIKSKPAMQWHCLTSVHCTDKGANCGVGQTDPQPVVLGHRAKLTTKSNDLPSKNSPTGVFVCLGTKQGNICTSGDGNVDTNMLGYNGLEILGQSVGYQFEGLYQAGGQRINPKDVITNNAGKLSVKLGNQATFAEPLEMQDMTPAGLPRKWLALNLVSPQILSTGAQGGEQQGTFTFEGALGRCTSISWDPYGVVFDSQSLEPVAGVGVTLTKKRSNGSYTIALGDDAPSILNPVTTVEDGAFEFFVPDGTYRLQLAASGFVFPSLQTLNPNYSKVYSDVNHGEDIVEQGGIQHRDVPIDSKTAPYHSNVKLMAYFPILDKGTDTMVIQGRVTHPLTKINIYGRQPSEDGKETYTRTKLLTSLIADKTGQFDIRYSMSKLGPTEILGDIELIKPDYVTMQYDSTKSTIFTVEPIPNYLEGYAYDQSGKPMANATVGVYLNLSNKPAYETTTDANGFFRISSEFLPSMAFGIKYSGAAGTASVSTSKFIAQNAKYLQTQGTNLFVFKNRKGGTFSLAERARFSIEEGLTPSTGGNKPVSIAGLTSNLLPIVIILVFLGLAGVATIVFFMKKK